MIKLSILLFLTFALHAQTGGEFASCYASRLSIDGVNPANGSLRINANDSAHTSQQYVVRAFIDDPTNSSATDFIDMTTSGGTAVWPVVTATTWGTGTKNPNDNTQHSFTAYMFSLHNGNVVCHTGMPTYYKSWSGVSHPDFTYQPFGSTLGGTFASGASSANLAVVFNPNDIYSTGTNAGNLQCTVNGVAVYDNGSAGYYIKKRSIPCGHVHNFPVTVADSVSPAAAATAYAAMSPAFGSDEHFGILTFMQPFQVFPIPATGQPSTVNAYESVTWFLATGGAIITPYTVFASSTQTQGTDTFGNPYFASSTNDPFTTYGIRPFFALIGETCTINNKSCTGGTTQGAWVVDFPSIKTLIDATFAGVHTAPTAGVIYIKNVPADNTRSAQFGITPPKAYGTNTGVAPNALNVQIVTGTGSTTLVETNIAAYTVPLPTMQNASNPTFKGGAGVGYLSSTTSINADYSIGGGGITQQSPNSLFLNYGAGWACGTVNEPFTFTSFRNPEILLMMSSYTRGDSAVEAAYRAVRDPATVVCNGDPLTQAYIYIPPITRGTAIVM